MTSKHVIQQQNVICSARSSLLGTIVQTNIDNKKSVFLIITTSCICTLCTHEVKRHREDKWKG